MAETLSGSDLTDTQIKAFMMREERLQTYEFIAHSEKKERMVNVDIDFLLLFKTALKARLEKITFVEYVEKVLEAALNNFEESNL